MVYECPLCGLRSNRRGGPFESVDAVVAHIDAKQNEIHADEWGIDYRREIVAVETPATGGTEPSVSAGAVPDNKPVLRDYEAVRDFVRDYNRYMNDKLDDYEPKDLGEIVERERKSDGADGDAEPTGGESKTVETFGDLLDKQRLR